MRYRTRPFAWLLVLLACAGTCFSAELAWPPVTQQTKPWSRWWWLGGIATPSGLTTQMERYAAAGLGGLEITPIYGVKGYENQFRYYLTPEWMEIFTHSLREGKRLGLGIDMATGNGWPFGGLWVDADDACKDVVYKTYTVEAGQRLTEPVVFIQQPMVRRIVSQPQIGELAPGAVKEPIRDNQNLQALALYQVRFEKPLPLVVLMAYSDGGQVLDLTAKVGRDGKLDWTAPAGKWTLYGVFQGWHGKMVESAGPGGEGNVIDHFNAAALRNYLNHFDEAFAGNDISGLRAFFNDSYEVDDASGESNWTPQFFAEFQRRRGYDLRRHLPALFGKDTPEKNLRVLCDYRETISDLLLDRFTIPWNTWANGHGATTRDQAHGSPANILDLYAASGIPETEGNDILRFQFASSAAHVAGKQLASAEAATWLEEHFSATLADVKKTVDLFFLGGINHICYHGTPYSPPDASYPGFLFYAAVNFAPTNSFWNDFPILNSYVTRVQSFLQAGKPDNDILLYYPMYDRWSDPGRSMLQHEAGGGQGTSARTVGEQMLASGYPFDLISDRQLAGARLSGKAIVTAAGTSYKTVLVPPTKYMPLATFQKLRDMARDGATVVFQGNLPGDVSGWANLEANRTAFRRIATGLKFAAAPVYRAQVAPVGRGRFVMGDDLRQLLSEAGIVRETMVDQELQFTRRKLAGGEAYLVVNNANSAVDGWVPIAAPSKATAIFDPMTGESGLGAIRISGAGTNEIYLQMAPGQSVIVRAFDTAQDAPKWTYWQRRGEPVALSGLWSVRFTAGNTDGLGVVQTRQLTSWTNFAGDAVKSFSGTGVYTLAFPKPGGNAREYLLDLGRVAESARVRLNGKEIAGLIRAPFQVRIPASELQANNTIEVAVSNLMANRIAGMDRRGETYRIFYGNNFPAHNAANRGPDGNFTAIKWPPRDSGLIGPVTLTALDPLTF